jgi:hypothetical protein
VTDSRVFSPPTLAAVLQGAPPGIADLAAAACQYVEQAVGVGADFTAETLPVVDHYVSLVRPEAPERPELLSLIARTLGAYFGQVVVRELGGFWHVPSDDDHRWLVCLRHVLLAFNPVGIAYEVLLQTSGSGPSPEILLAPEEREVVFARLESLPPVDETEYFMFATRLEGLEIAAVALSTLRDEATADVEFEWEDYRCLAEKSSA